MLNILYTVNDSYVDIMLVSLISIIENNQHINICFHIVADNFSLNEYHKIESIIKRYNNVQIKYYDFHKFNIKQFNIMDWRGTQIANSRLFFQSIIKDIDNMNNLLYLDGDTVCVGELSNLLNPKNAISPVKDSCLKERIKKYNLTSYYNSGVLLFNPHLWAVLDYEKTIRDFISKNDISNFLYPDQDILNISLKDKIATLPFQYNMGPNSVSFNDFLLKLYYNKFIRSLSYQEVKTALNDRKILHSYGLSGIKPWTYNKSNLITPEFDKYLSLIKKEYTKEELSDFLKFCDNHSTLLFFLVTLKSYLPEEINNKINKLVKKS